MIRMNGFDDCIAGVVERFGQPDILCYDIDKVIEKLMEQDRMTYEGAVEFWQYNQLNVWAGDSTPCFLRSLNEADDSVIVEDGRPIAAFTSVQLEDDNEKQSTG